MTYVAGFSTNIVPEDLWAPLQIALADSRSPDLHESDWHRMVDHGLARFGWDEYRFRELTPGGERFARHLAETLPERERTGMLRRGEQVLV